MKKVSEDKIFIVSIIITIVIILMSIIVVKSIKAGKENVNIEYENVTSEGVTLIPLKIGGVEKIENAELLKINDYEIVLSKRLNVDGYDMEVKNNKLTITSKDKKYKMTLFQLTDNYISPTDEEVDAYYETPEYKAWDEEMLPSSEEEEKLHYAKGDAIKSA